MKLQSIFAVLALAVARSAFAQPEQWLTFHTADPDAPRNYVRVELTTNAPAGVALPKFNATPYFARWVTPMDPAGGRWLCLDRSHRSGPYDRMYIDSTGNGRLDDKKPVAAQDDSSMVLFPATPVVFKGEDGPINYPLVVRVYSSENLPYELLATPGGWYEGAVKFDGVKKHFELHDGNVNGTFNDIAPDPYACDRVEVEGNTNGEVFLGRMLETDGKFFRIEAARDGAYVKVQKAENVELGSVRVPTNISEFAASGENGHFARKPANGEFTLPLGKYRIFHWTIDRKDNRGQPWTLAGHAFPDTATFEVAAGTTATLDIGEPVRALLSYTNHPDREVVFNLQFQGHQKESIEMLRGGERPAGPKLTLANTNGSVCFTNSFEFG
jgi:hypothetical protein